MKLSKRLFGIATAMLVFAAGASAADVGAAAPAFSLKDIDGNEHALSDYSGKVVVLEWTNYGCPFVRKHYDSGNMQGLQEATAGKEVVWLSICSSAEGKQGHMSESEWHAAIKSNGVKASSVLLDESGMVGKKYGAIATPHMFVIDEDGVLVYDGAIDSIASANQSDIAKAENYVMAAVDAVLAGKPVAVKKSKPYGCGVKYSKDS